MGECARSALREPCQGESSSHDRSAGRVRPVGKCRRQDRRHSLKLWRAGLRCRPARHVEASLGREGTAFTITLHPNPRPLNFAANSGILAMQTNLSVRFFRVRTGWRREEWAHRPLFICGKFFPKVTGNQGDTREKQLPWGGRDLWRSV